MALQLELTDPSSGLVMPEAYVRITGVIFDSGLSRMELQIGIYASRAARREGHEPVMRRVFLVNVGYSPGYMDLEKELPRGWRAAMYDWMKGLPEFAKAADVLDEEPTVPLLTTAELLTDPWSVRVVLDRPTIRDTPVTVLLRSDTPEVEVPHSIVIGSGEREGSASITVNPVTSEKVATITVTLDTVIFNHSIALSP